MRILFCGTPHDALPRDLSRLGHEVLAPEATDWWAWMQAHRHPDHYADSLWRTAREFAPDALVLHKGWHWWVDHPTRWAVPHEVLWALRERVPSMLYLCADDPAATPVSLGLQIPGAFDAWLTTCEGIVDPPLSVRGVRVEPFWLAWDEDVQPRVDPALADVDVAITGHPYYRPFPAPHYQLGFSTPRRSIAHRAIERGMRLGIWGPGTWLEEEHGGDPRLAAWFHGWLDPTQIHVVHASACAVVATQLVEGRGYESGRLPFVCGAGGALVHELRPGLAEAFGDAALFFRPGDVDGALNLCAELRADPARRDRLCAAGRALVLDRHCWKHRAERLAQLAEEVRRPAVH